MRYFKLALTAVALATLGIAASAQVTSGLTPQASAAPSGLPKGKIAVINTAMFQAQVFEFKSRIEALNKQFEPRVKDVQGLAEKAEQIETMKKEYQRKAEDLQADANRARDKAFEPIQAKLGKFAEQYTATRGIIMLIDLANAVQSGTLLWYDPRSDVSLDFINEYNKANPAPAAAPASPKP